MKVYQQLSTLIQAIANCEARDNQEWLDNHRERLQTIVKEYFPSGSGINSGCVLNLDQSTPNKLVIETTFHHMDENGSYYGWTNHSIIVKPDLANGIVLTVHGNNRNDIKSYLYDLFRDCLSEEIER